jgi:hypothetical protein
VSGDDTSSVGLFDNVCASVARVNIYPESLCA